MFPIDEINTLAAQLPVELSTLADQPDTRRVI
jgi:hypothetical protein